MKPTTLYAIIAASLLVFGACKPKHEVQLSFKSQIVDANIQIGYGLAIGDVDGDAKLDILLADKKQFVWYSNPDWQRYVMIDSLTDRDNVCIAARDINGDGKVEVAVGAQWNPGESSDKEKSGSVHYLIRPEDPRELWEAIPLYHEPTVHRMRWVKGADSYQLVVLPLHGIGNVKGEGSAVNVLSYEVPQNPRDIWKHHVINSGLHMTHNMDIISKGEEETLILGGKEGAADFQLNQNTVPLKFIESHGFGEIRHSENWLSGIQPIHGNELVIYGPDEKRKVLTDSLKEGHALAWGDFLDAGFDQLVVGWRGENEQKEVGIKLFIPSDKNWTSWRSVWVDKNGMACEDLKVADLNGDGQLDIVAAGRSTHNLKVYWNELE